MISKLRHLSFDDLYILSYLYQQKSTSEMARLLHVSQPAISQRLRKIGEALNLNLTIKSGRRLTLSPGGRELAKRAVEVINLMESRPQSISAQEVIKIGTRPEIGRSWLWPTISCLRIASPRWRFDICMGSGEQILTDLSNNQLDCVLTSAPLLEKRYSSFELVREDYVLVAVKKIANSIHSIADFSKVLWIEHDRSFPFFHYISSTQKQKIKLQDVWFIESSQLMVSAIANGFGIGIVPEYLVREHLKAKSLVQLDLGLKIRSDSFRLVYHKNTTHFVAIEALAESLRDSELRA